MRSEVLLRVVQAAFDGVGCCTSLYCNVPVDRSGRVIVGGQELTGRGFIGRVNEDTNTLHLQVRTHPSGIVCHQGCSQAVTLQHADDQFGLNAAANDRQHRHAVHDFQTPTADLACAYTRRA